MRKISWYDNNGNIKFVQNCEQGLEDISAPEDNLDWIEGCPEIIDNAKVVNNEIINGNLTEDETTELIRKIRNVRLKDSDWTQGADSPLSDTKKTEWQTYRQALRDLPAGYQDTNNIDEVAFPNLPQ